MTEQKRREEIIGQWFHMWLTKSGTGIENIFSEDAVYTESWGPEYVGAEKIRHWFCEWNGRGSVLAWDIKRFFHNDESTAVEWYFKNEMDNGRVEEFDGVTVVDWDGAGRIKKLREYGCNINNYDPYRDGPEPKFRDEPAVWF